MPMGSNSATAPRPEDRESTNIDAPETNADHQRMMSRVAVPLCCVEVLADDVAFRESLSQSARADVVGH